MTAAHTLHRAVAGHRALADALRRQFPDVDDQALADTLEGETTFDGAVGRVLRHMAEDEALVAGLGVIMGEFAARKKRLEARIERTREAIADAMSEVGMAKVVTPLATVTVRAGKPEVIVTDEAALPTHLTKTTVSPDKRAIREAIERGETIDGVTLGNGASVLTIRRA